MNVCVIGCGYVGFTISNCLASLGNNVTCIELDPFKVKTMKEGRSQSSSKAWMSYYFRILVTKQLVLLVLSINWPYTQT